MNENKQVLIRNHHFLIDVTSKTRNLFLLKNCKIQPNEQKLLFITIAKCDIYNFSIDSTEYTLTLRLSCSR